LGTETNSEGKIEVEINKKIQITRGIILNIFQNNEKPFIKDILSQF
jgi:hypothetical protein